MLFLLSDDIIKLLDQMADYDLNQPFCSDEVIGPYEIVRS